MRNVPPYYAGNEERVAAFEHADLSPGVETAIEFLRENGINARWNDGRMD